MKTYFENLARALLGRPYRELDQTEQSIIQSIAEGETVVEDVNAAFHQQLTLGQRMADRISAFGGSWLFILLFLGVLISWMLLNSLLLVEPGQAFDPYPYILLNLVLSTLAALQAPIIMMSQNRQTAKDRLAMTESYKVSLKMELEIQRLHQRLDELCSASNHPRPDC